MRVLVTGADGFIGKNLVLKLREQLGIEVLTYVREQQDEFLREVLTQSDAVVHLAGVNRPNDVRAFADVNTGLTKRLCQLLKDLGKNIPLLLASSTQVELDNPYGLSKLAAEQALEALANENGNPVAIFRLPGVFGKWCMPNYNSVVATFCHNKANDLPIQINDPNTNLRLVYVDDVVNTFISHLFTSWSGLTRPTIAPEYRITIAELSNQIDAFYNCRSNLELERVGTGLTRALYSTYLSYLPVEKFSFSVPAYSDVRGVFVEMLKTPDSGQFSFFTALPNITRGGHYHHTKNEKFLVIKGHARFKFRHVLTNELYQLETHGDQLQIVQTVPGWTHDITNIGSDEMYVMLWANEIFDRFNPDTFVSKV